MVVVLTAPVAVGIAAEPAGQTPEELRSALKDLNVLGADFWIYNNLQQAIAEAKKANKPIFVTFRCVPCKACAGFDAEVAKGSDIIARLARDKFVSLRQVEMKGVDLSQFQFDYDLNWAAMFINADGTVYGRYGTQSAAGPDAFNSIASLENAMQRVLELHEAYPANKAALADKRGADKPYKTAMEMPELHEKEKRTGPTARNNCIHCHNIHDAQQEEARKAGTLTAESLWRYPLPDNLGIHVDRNDGRKIETIAAGSAAAAAGLRPGDAITHVNGQAIISIADIQWVLHNLPNSAAEVKIMANREGASSEYVVKPAEGWKKTDWSWRGSRWSLKPHPGFWAPLANANELKALKLEEGAKAYRIQWINRGESEGKKAFEAGLREGDFIIAIDGKPVTLTPEKFQMQVRTQYKVGDKLPLTILRNGKQLQIDLPLVD
jgi:hypothetical protein